jgi:PemK-like, MazF-like toxin of type II toxin-antitoxin system
MRVTSYDPTMAFATSVRRILQRVAAGVARGNTSSRPPSNRPDRNRPVPHGVHVEYSPHVDGDPDPGEVVWAWVPYEDDPTQGKDRPIVIIGRTGDDLAGVPLTSKNHHRDDEVAVGTGPWDRDGRPSFAKVDQLLTIDPDTVRREGAILSRPHFDDVVAGVSKYHRLQQP